MSLPIKKIYIDTRFKTKDSKSHSDFSIQLPSSYYMPKNTVFYIDSLCVPVSFYGVQKNRNNLFFFSINGGVLQQYELPEGNYKADLLIAALVNAINAIRANTVTGEFNIELNYIALTIAAGVNLVIPTDEELLSTYSKSYPVNSINDVLRNVVKNQVYNSTTKFQVDYCDFFPIRNLFLTSSNLGNHNTIHAGTGASNIIKVVSVNTGYNGLLIDHQVLGSDYLDCSGQSLNLLSFKLTNAFGSTIDLNGNHFSFTIIFSKLSEEN